MNIYEKYKDLAPDEFVDIPGWEGYYQINLNEQVKSFDRTTLSTLNKYFSYKGKILEGCINQGYREVRLTKNGKGRTYKIHILLAMTFIPNPEGHKLVRHLNDIKTDNRLQNLAWGTKKDNAHDAIRNGTFHKLINEYGVHVCSKIVLNKESGVFYYSLGEAANAHNVPIRKLGNRLNGTVKNKTSLVYV